jgi:DNA-binding LacI/PurR family transcriptional regulator
MKNTATLKEISDHLSISISTASRALKDHPDMAPETKRRVKELAAMPNYEPNAFAVNLRKKHSNVFAVVVPEISNYFYHSFIQAVEEDARHMGYTLMIDSAIHERPRNRRAEPEALPWQPCGWHFHSPHQPHYQSAAFQKIRSCRYTAGVFFLIKYREMMVSTRCR